jgi:hypothetical protein
MLRADGRIADSSFQKNFRFTSPQLINSGPGSHWLLTPPSGSLIVQG